MLWLASADPIVFFGGYGEGRGRGVQWYLFCASAKFAFMRWQEDQKVGVSRSGSLSSKKAGTSIH